MSNKKQAVDALIAKLDKAIKRQRGTFHQMDLCEGLSDKTLAKDRRNLPRALSKLWSWHNGQEDFSSEELVPGGQLLSYEASKKLSGEKPWAPFLDHDDHWIGIDLTTGAVVLRPKKPSKKRGPLVLAPSLEAWLGVMLEAAEAEIWEIEDLPRLRAFICRHLPGYPTARPKGTAKEAPPPTAAKAVSFDLGAEVAKVKAGATLTLPKGTIAIRTPLKIEKPMTLRGAGAEATLITGACPEAIIEIKVKPGEKVALSALGVRRMGGIGDVIRVSAGSATIRDASVRGGRERKDDFGEGVLVRGKAVLEMSGCRVDDNDAAAIGLIDESRGRITNCITTSSHDGIVATNRARLVAQGCRSFGHKMTGIAFIEKATGDAKRCVCSEAMTGILVGGKAKASVVSCESRNNAWHGFCAYESGEADVENCLFENNQRIGALFCDEAGGSLVKNHARGNSWHGLAVECSKKTVVRDNHCEQNSQHGISIGGKGAPVIEANQCVMNGISGINPWGDSTANVTNNVCEHNFDYGIIIAERAKPRIEGNVCRNNNVGISYDQGAGAGVARGNRCLENRESEIEVLDKATPLIEENTCADGAGDGILVSGQAKPTLRKNRVTGNNGSGIEYHDGGGGKALDNQCTANMEDGIGVYIERGKLELERNVCRENWGRGIFIDGDVKRSAVVLAKNESAANKADFDEEQFLRYLPVGENSRLMRLMRWWREHRFETCQFSMDGERENAAKSWLDGDTKKAKHLRVFGACGEGSLLAFWLKNDANARRIDEDSTPVVFLGSEGEGSKVVARNFGEFLSLLAHGADDLSIELARPPSRWSRPSPNDDHHPRVLRFLRSELGVKPAERPADIVRRAMNEVGDLDAWLAQ